MKFEIPEIMVVHFAVADIIATSGGEGPKQPTSGIVNYNQTAAVNSGSWEKLNE